MSGGALGPPPELGERLKDHALAYLARYAASRAAVRRVLVRRARRLAPDATPEELRAAVEAVLARLAELELVDDARLAAARTRNLAASGASSRAIAAKLAAAGIAREHRERALGALRDEDPAAELRAAVTLARRRGLGPFRPPDARAGRRERDLAALLRAGFPRPVARSVIDAADPGELEED